MSIIFRVEDESRTPDWLVEKLATADCPCDQEIKSLSETQIVEECDKIELCASKNEPYQYDPTIDNDSLSRLNEYATACGTKIVKANVSYQPIQKTASIIKTASKEKLSEVESLKYALGDPFHIEERANKIREKDQWEDVKPQKKMAHAPKMGGINAIRGGEDYFTNSDVNLAANQNSITNPNAIGKLAESKEEDTGERLKREKLEREAERKERHADWQKELVASMKVEIPKGNVFPTESLNSSTGISSNRPGIYSKFNFSDLPEKTEGETISQKNAERKQSIQKQTEKYDFQKDISAKNLSISDLFGEALKKNLGK